MLVSTIIHPFWYDGFFYAFVGLSIMFFIIMKILMGTMKKKAADLKLIQQQHVARIDGIRKDHMETLEHLRIEMLRKEEERTRQWMESEKEALNVLNGVSNVLELSDRITKVDSNKVLKLLYEIEEKVTTNKGLINKLQITENKYHMLFNSNILGFAFHEVILADDKPVDYKFIEVNPAFEKLTGLDAKQIIGKTIREVMPDVENHWIETYGKVALSGKTILFENYNKTLEKYYQVTAYSPEPYKFVTIFTDIKK